MFEAVERSVGEDSLPIEREAGLAAFGALAREGGRPVEPFLLPMLPRVLACHADKVRPCCCRAALLPCRLLPVMRRPSRL